MAHSAPNRRGLRFSHDRRSARGAVLLLGLITLMFGARRDRHPNSGRRDGRATAAAPLRNYAFPARRTTEPETPRGGRHDSEPAREFPRGDPAPAGAAERPQFNSQQADDQQPDASAEGAGLKGDTGSDGSQTSPPPDQETPDRVDHRECGAGEAAEGPAGSSAGSSPSESEPGDKSGTPAGAVVDKPQKVLLRGEVLLLPEALRQRGVKTYSEEIARQVVLKTPTGELIPLVPDWRGRAFGQDERLRSRPVELVVNRRAGIPWVSVLSIYAHDEGGKRSVVDYWCDVCAIPMYEIKDCECCQGPIRLRFRPQSLPRDVPAVEDAPRP